MRATASVAVAAAALLALFGWRRRARLARQQRPLIPRAALQWAKVRARRHLLVLANLREVAGTLGVDIGGTLAKMVLLRRIREGEKHERVSFGACFNTQPSLSFDVYADDGTSLTLHFVAAPTRSLAEAVETLRNCDGQPAAPAVESGPKSGPRLQRRESVYSSVRHVVAAGGGAHKYAALFEEVLRVRLVPFAELAALVEGLHFLRAVGPADELYALPGPSPGGDGSGSATTSGGEGGASEAAEERVAWEEVDFPYIVVNIGSGVSAPILPRLLPRLPPPPPSLASLPRPSPSPLSPPPITRPSLPRAPAGAPPRAGGREQRLFTPLAVNRCSSSSGKGVSLPARGGASQLAAQPSAASEGRPAAEQLSSASGAP